VQLDARARISDEQVRRDALRQLRISASSLRVTKIGAATFLLRFTDPALRTAALGARAISIGYTSLRLRPWTRQFGAQASKLRYRVRVCLEGVPSHAWQCEVVAPLFGQPSFVEEICDKRYLEKEKECFCLWIWTDDPTTIAKSGSLQLEEPITVTEEYFIHLGNMGSPYVRRDQAEMLKFEVLIHVDQVQDFSTPPASPHRSEHSTISRVPSDEPEDEWPVCYRFDWSLGVRDGEVGQPRRTPVHDRLGGRRRDDSPPGGGRGGHSLHQFPPPSLHDIRRDGRFAPSSSSFGGGGHSGNTGWQGHRRRAVAGDEEHVLSNNMAVGNDGQVLEKIEGGKLTQGGFGNSEPVSNVNQNKKVQSEVPGWTMCLFLFGETHSFSSRAQEWTPWWKRLICVFSL